MTNGYQRLDLTDRVVIVTGAAGGIVCATARLCAACGGRMILADLDVERGRALACGYFNFSSR